MRWLLVCLVLLTAATDNHSLKCSAAAAAKPAATEAAAAKATAAKA